jgi:Fe-S cluster assembly scaffold protein SufB
MDLNMKVNVLPVLTYNFLNVNGSTLQADNIKIDASGYLGTSAVPAGVKRDEMSFAQAGEVFNKVREQMKAAAPELAGPNAETASRDEEQAIRTGMGMDIDALMIGLDARAEVFSVDEGAVVTEPIVLKGEFKSGEQALYSQVIHAGRNSEVTVVLYYDSEREAEGFVGVSTRILAEEGAKVTLVKAQTLGDGFVHFDDIGGVCQDGGAINLVTLELGGSKVWNGVYTHLFGKESALDSNLGYLCRQDHNLDLNYVADQRGKKTSAGMQFKGVLMDTASKTFRGTLDFKSGSSGSVGDEQEDALLLSEDVINRSMPVILCQEEDVEGRHGATIGQLGEDLLFYMQSRGIDQDEAKRIMIKARLESIARMIPDQEVKQRVKYYIQNIV